MPADLSMELDLSAFTTVGRRVRQRLSRVVRVTAYNIEARTKQAIQSGPKTGRIYERGEQQVSFATKTGKQVDFTARKGKPSRLHQASAPGEAPATDEGNLVNSIQTRHVAELASEVTVGAEYGAALELGTADGKIAPRPALGPTVDAEWPAFDAAVASTLGKAAQ